MPILKIRVDASGLLADVENERIEESNDITLATLEDGMTSGNPSLAIVIRMPDGRAVLAQTSLALFLQAARIFRSKFGEPDPDAPARETIRPD